MSLNNSLNNKVHLWSLIAFAVLIFTLPSVSADDLNHGTLELSYNTGGNLRVEGTAPLGTTNIWVAIYDENNSGTYLLDQSISPDANRDYSHTFSLLALEPQILNIRAYFMDANGQVIYQAKELFEGYLVDSLEQRITAADADLNSLWDADTNTWVAIGDLNVHISNLYIEIANITHEIDMLQSHDFIQDWIIAMLNFRLTALENRLASMNHGTMEMSYNTGGNLRIAGTAPIGTANIWIAIYDENNSGTYLLDQSISPDASDNSYYHTFSLHTIEPQILTVRTYFMESGGHTIYLASDVLEAYLVDDLESRVNDLNVQLQVADGNIAYLMLVDQNLTIAINDLNAEINNIYGKLDVIDDRLDGIEMDVSFLKMRVHQLQNQINFLRMALVAMNHATINMFYNSNAGTLSVWGEAAAGTTSLFMPDDVGLAMIPVDDIFGGPDYMDFTDLDSGNRYQFSGITGNPVPVGALNPVSYNILVFMYSNVRPSGAPPIYIVGTIFDTLAIEDLDERVTELEEKVDMLNAGNIQFSYNSSTNRGTIHGESPTEARCARVYAYSSSGSYLGSGKTMVFENPMGSDYSMEEYMGDWPQEAINVYVSFYRSSHCTWGYLSTVSDTFDSLLSEDLFGFRDITTSTYVTSYYVNHVKVPITFALKPDKAGLYKIDYQVNEMPWRSLQNCNWYSEGIKTYKTGDLEFYTTGTKRITLRATPCFGPPVAKYTSYEFKINHVDLKDSLMAATTIVSPSENSDTTLPWPYGSIEANVYWTQSGIVPLTAYLTTNTRPDRSTCEVHYYSTDIGSGPVANPSSYDIIDDGTKWVCDTSGEFNTSQWGNQNYVSVAHTKIRVYNDVVAQADGFDEINIGIDNTPPYIGEIVPDESGIMHGMYTWFAEITDDLSGIGAVTFHLIEKDGVEYCEIIDEETQDCHIGDGNVEWSWSLNPTADFNSEKNMFYYDLNTLEHPDGDYNVMFEAWDIAGNYAYKEVDPIIDNTPPKIHDVSMNPNPAIRGNPFLVDVNTTDNITGVNTVLATVTGGAINETIVLAYNSGVYSGTFSPDMNWAIGTYTLTIDVNDNAGNLTNTTRDFNVFEDYAFNLALSANPIYNGGSTELTGQLVSDTGRQVNDANVEITASFLTPTLVVTDANGYFTLSFSVANSGVYEITAQYSDVNTGYTDSIDLTVNEPNQQNNEEETGDSGGSGGGGGGGGGGGSGETSASRLLNVSPVNAMTGDEIQVSALCKWSFGCRIRINGKVVADMTNSSGFQDFPQVFDEAGEYNVELYFKGTEDTLVADRTVTITAPEEPEEEPQEEEPEEEPQGGTPNEPAAPTGDEGGETPPEEGGETPPTGFFGLGNYDFGSLGESGLGILLLLLVLAGIVFIVVPRIRK